MSESEEEANEEVREKFKDLLQGLRFRFEGLSTGTEEVFVKLVQDMGAEVANNASITFVQKSYFEKNKNKRRNSMYNIDYIMESVKAGLALELEKYMFVPIANSNDDPMCYAARYIYKTDSCQKCYYERVFCKECIIENNQESQVTPNQDRSHIISATDSSSESEEEITTSPDQKAVKHRSKSPKRLISSDSEGSCIEKSPVRKKLRNSSDVNDTYSKEQSPETDIENDSNRSNGNHVKNPIEEPIEESINGNFVEAHDIIKQKMAHSKSSPRKNIENDMEKDHELSNNFSASASNFEVEENKKSAQKVTEASKSQWITSSKSKALPVENELPESGSEFSKAKASSIKTELSELSESGSDLEVEIATDDEEENYFKERIWWVPHDIPLKERCTVENCTFEPGDHRAHYRPRKFLSLVEKKIVVKYLIMKNKIPQAKGKKAYESMHQDHYLTHRTWETLRNSFRRTIIKEIRKYKLDDSIVKEFERLRVRNTKKKKREKQ